MQLRIVATKFSVAFAGLSEEQLKNGNIAKRFTFYSVIFLDTFISYFTPLLLE
jgi:hypothetical protein